MLDPILGEGSSTSNPKVAHNGNSQRENLSSDTSGMILHLSNDQPATNGT